MTEKSNHALLSASSAQRWMTCTPSARLEAEEHTEDCSVYAREGTLAHAFAEIRLSHVYGKISAEERFERENALMMDEDNKQYLTEDFFEAVNGHVEYIRSVTETLSDYSIFFEVTVDFSNVVPQGFGTADVLIVTRDTIHVIDLKFGRGLPVTAKKNPQLRLYGIGALNLFPASKKIIMTINQPRIYNRDTEELNKEDLLQWAFMDVIPKAELAIKGEGMLTPTESACRFCKIRTKCKARADKEMDVIHKNFLVKDDRLKMAQTLTPEQLSEVLRVAPAVSDWIKDVQAFALGQLMSGVKIPGYKLVEGRSSRVITEPEKVRDILVEAGHPLDVLMKPSELKTITQLETVVGKKRFAELCHDYIDKPRGKLSIAQEDDERPEANTYYLAVDEFK